MTVGSLTAFLSFVGCGICLLLILFCCDEGLV
jgi:hypothetical protein